MLQNIRDNSQGIVAKVIIGLIIGVFALFGVESIVGGFMNTSTVAEVNGEEISDQQLAVSVQNLIASIGGNIENLDENLLQQIALSQIVEDKLLIQSAVNSDMTIADSSIDLAIINTPQFQLNGVFDRDLALRTMGAQGFSPQTYRAALAERMLIGQLSNAFAASTFITEAELELIAALTLQTRDFRYLSVTLGSRTLGEPIPPEDIDAYYQSNPGQFMQEEEVAINYVVLDKAAMYDEVELAPERILAQYELEKEDLASSAQRRAAHILLETGADLSEADGVLQAIEIRTRIDAGEDFAALADEFSSDRISAEEGGDIGYTDGSVFPEALEQALLDLQVGQVSDPVVSEFGVHLVKLTEYDVTDFAAFDEVAERIERDLKATEVDRIYFERLETLANLAFETGDLQDISEQLSLEIREGEFFTRSGGSSRYTTDSRVITAAFSEEVLLGRNNSEIIEFDTSEAMVLHVREHNEASLRPLEEVRGEIAAMLRGQLERQRAQALGEEILAALRSGESVEELMTTAELEWITAESVSRNQANVNNEVLQATFNIPAPTESGSVFQGATLNNGTYVVIELDNVNPGNLAAMSPQERDSLHSSIIERSGRAAFDAYLANLRSSAKIVER